MGMSSRPQSQRSGAQRRGADAQAMRGNQSRTRNTLKSDRDNTMSTKPVAQKDQYGSRHNEDDLKKHQKQRGRAAAGGKPNLEFRESGQDVQPDRGARNKQPGSRTRKSGSAEK
jgi:hypothetical protein